MNMNQAEPEEPSSVPNGKTVLVLGGTGAMGVYLVPELAARGCQVTVVSWDDIVSDDPRITYVKADGTDMGYLKELLKEPFDGIVDFLMYPGNTFNERYDLLLQNTCHYFYLSTYRVYDGIETPITEEAPRLLDNSQDRDFLATDDYALFKARGEDILQNSSYDNWTIVRPTITYSQRRFQLVTLEAPDFVGRALQGLPVVLPEEARSIQATMSWAGDLAKMFAGLLFNPAARREVFTLATAEHHTWGEIAEYYNEIIGLKLVWADADDYLKILGGFKGINGTWYQLVYDRLFDRMIDNAKVLRVAGLQQEALMPLRLGLERELTALPELIWSTPTSAWKEMDKFLRRGAL